MTSKEKEQFKKAASKIKSHLKEADLLAKKSTGSYWKAGKEISKVKEKLKRLRIFTKWQKENGLKPERVWEALKIYDYFQTFKEAKSHSIVDALVLSGCRKIREKAPYDKEERRAALGKVKGAGQEYFLDDFPVLNKEPKVQIYNKKKTKKTGGMNRIVKYPGSKVLSMQRIVSIFPNHDLFVSVFGGSGAEILSKEPSPKEVFNDLDNDVFNVFKVLRDTRQRNQLIKLLDLTPFSRTQFAECLELRDSGVDLKPVEKAWIFLVLGWMG